LFELEVAVVAIDLF